MIESNFTIDRLFQRFIPITNIINYTHTDTDKLFKSLKFYHFLSDFNELIVMTVGTHV